MEEPNYAVEPEFSAIGPDGCATGDEEAKYRQNLDQSHMRLMNIEAARRFENVVIYGLIFFEKGKKLKTLESWLKDHGYGYFIKPHEGKFLLCCVVSDLEYEKILADGFRPVDVDQMLYPDFLQTVRNM